MFNSVSWLSDAVGTVESSDDLGGGTVVKRGHPLSGVDQSFILKVPESFGDAGDQYTGLDRFGRVDDQWWRTSSADVERTLYGYDRNGNRTSRTNTVNTTSSPDARVTPTSGGCGGGKSWPKRIGRLCGTGADEHEIHATAERLLDLAA